jgi:hypothetical protein
MQTEKEPSGGGIKKSSNAKQGFSRSHDPPIIPETTYVSKTRFNTPKAKMTYSDP